MEIVNQFSNYVFSALPTSPFKSAIAALGELPYLSWLNWFIPIGTFITIGTAWLTAIALFYLYSIILRWIRAID